MTDRFMAAFTNVVGIEGKYSNNPHDPGGETMYGITVKVARAFGYLGPMQSMPMQVACDIYHKQYWTVINADNLPGALAEFLFDLAVNSGPGTAARALQAAVGALPDGIIGPHTLTLVAARTESAIVRLIFVARAKIFAHHPDLATFENGWFARLFDVTYRFAKEEP